MKFALEHNLDVNQLMRATIQSSRFPLSFGSAPTHGALWHRMVHHHSNVAHELWGIVYTLCNFTHVFMMHHFACVHGSGHGMLLNHLSFVSLVKIVACRPTDYHGRVTRMSELEAALLACRADRLGAYFCMGGVWDQYFETLLAPSPESWWPGQCAWVAGPSSPCFTYYLTGNEWYFEMHYATVSMDSCLTAQMPEDNRQGCIVHFAKMESASGVMHVCTRFVPFLTEVGKRRMVSCITGVMIGASYESPGMLIKPSLRVDDCNMLKSINFSRAFMVCTRLLPYKVLGLQEALATMPPGVD